MIKRRQIEKEIKSLKWQTEVTNHKYNKILH